ARAEQLRYRMLREPLDLEVRSELAELVGDRDVSGPVSEADRRGGEQRAAWAVPGGGPRSRCPNAARDAVGEVADHQVRRHGLPRGRKVTGAVHDEELAASELRQPLCPRARNDPVLGAPRAQHGALDPPDDALCLL